MKNVSYLDGDGFIRRATIRDTDPDTMAEYGIPSGPPDIRGADWNDFAREVNNALAENGLYTWDDVQQTQGGIQPALTLFKRLILMLYRQEDMERKQSMKDRSK